MHDNIGTRMKENYESIPNNRLTRRMPVIIRLDGKAFHSFTKGFNRPFDTILIATMQETAKKLCENIQNAVFAYTQSDEISILMADYKELQTSAWFDNKIQKITSVSASMATLYFNQIFRQFVEDVAKVLDIEADILGIDKVSGEYFNALSKACEKGALFDSRCFNIPKEEVTNYFLWRQLDATRNSIQMVAQTYYSHSQLHGKNLNDLQGMLLTEHNVNWNDFDTYLKRGTAIYYDNERRQWHIDRDMPILKNEGQNLINQFVFTE